MHWFATCLFLCGATACGKLGYDGNEAQFGPDARAGDEQDGNAGDAMPLATCDDGVQNGTEVDVDSGPDCPCAGDQLAGFCWYLGLQGESCTQTCATHDGDAPNGTLNFVGNAGSRDNCAAVFLEAFGNLQPTAFAPNGSELGCYLEVGDQPKWDSAGVTRMDDFDAIARRACACRR